MSIWFIAANGQGFVTGVELVFRPPTAAADRKYEVEVKN